LRSLLPALLLCLLGATGGDTLAFDPGNLLTLSGRVLQSLTADETVLLDYGGPRLLLEREFLPSGRTLVQLYLDRNFKPRTQDTLPPGNSFVRPYRGGSLQFTPLRPDRLTWIGERKEDLVPEDLPPGGLILFFVTGGDSFWLGTGRNFFCYDRTGGVTARFAVPGDALLAAADREGRLYLSFEGGALLSLPPRGGGPSLTPLDRSFSESDLILSTFAQAREIIHRDFGSEEKEFVKWVRQWGDALYRKDPLNRELGQFLRALS